MFLCRFIHFCFELAFSAYLKTLGDIISYSDGLFVKNDMIYELIHECIYVDDCYMNNLLMNYYMNAYVELT